jgi:tetratricopeptide (TPR) repeat protein
VFAYSSASIINAREIPPDTSFGDMMDSVDTSSGFFLFLAAAMIFAPFFEELLFRGYYFSVLSRVKGNVFAIIVIALSFSLLHVEQYWGDWAAIAMVTALGFVMTLFRYFTDSTVSSIIMHYVYNAGVMIFSIFMLISNNPAYFEYLGNAHLYTEEEKMEILSDIIKENPTFTDAYNELAIVHSMQVNKLNEGLNIINKALAYYPNRAVYLDTKAIILKKLNRLDEADDIAERLKENNPRYIININKYLELL